MSPAAAPPLLQWIEPLNDLARLRLLRVLSSYELGVGELGSVLQLPQSTVSRHLKRLLEAGWIIRRSVGTSALYRMSTSTLDDTARTLWALATTSMEEMPACSEDDHRAVEVIARRQVDSRQFFGDLGGEWTDLRERLFGSAVDLRPLMAFINPEWTVGDLGCGTGQMTAELAPWVHRVEAIDRETAMLAATRRRLEGIDNVGIHKADVTKLPFDEGALDASILSLILHHLESPGLALAEAGRVTAGPVIVVDMVAHDRTSYRDTMGHLHLGFTREDLTALAEASDLILDHYQPLPPDPDATGPPLFAARLRRAHRVV